MNTAETCTASQVGYAGRPVQRGKGKTVAVRPSILNCALILSPELFLCTDARLSVKHLGMFNGGTCTQLWGAILNTPAPRRTVRFWEPENGPPPLDNFNEMFKGHFLYNIKLLCKLPNT